MTQQQTQQWLLQLKRTEELLKKLIPQNPTTKGN